MNPTAKAVAAAQHHNLPADLSHARLQAWVADIAALTEAADVYW